VKLVIVPRIQKPQIALLLEAQGRVTHIIKPPSNKKIKDMSQPCVVSPLKPSQPNTRVQLKPDPDTSAVKTMRTRAAK
jgi:hypothetical protein